MAESQGSQKANLARREMSIFLMAHKRASGKLVGSKFPVKGFGPQLGAPLPWVLSRFMDQAQDDSNRSLKAPGLQILYL